MTQPPKSRHRPAAPDSLTAMSEILMAQALTLDGMFAELVENAANSKPYPLTLDRYTRLALRAQGNCRAALMGMVRVERELRQAQDAAAE